MGVPRFFLAHSKACGELELDELRRIATVALEVLSKGQPFEVVMGRDYFNARYKAAGSWNAWTREVAASVSYLTREPIFKAILVPQGPIGAGTAKIVQEALAVRKPVFSFDREGKCIQIVGLEVKNSANWQGGWGPIYLLAPMADAEVGEGSGYEEGFEPLEEDS
jgi:hypothetical protein